MIEQGWISVSSSLPSKGSYLVRFKIEILGVGTPFVDKVLYAEGFFDPENGWQIENRYVCDYRYEQPYQSPKMRVTHWKPIEDDPNVNKS